jgi:hypothetical protein
MIGAQQSLPPQASAPQQVLPQHINLKNGEKRL